MPAARRHACLPRPPLPPLPAPNLAPDCKPRTGTSREPPINPIFAYVADVLGLQLNPKHREGPGANALWDRWAAGFLAAIED